MIMFLLGLVGWMIVGCLVVEWADHHFINKYPDIKAIYEDPEMNTRTSYWASALFWPYALVLLLGDKFSE